MQLMSIEDLAVYLGDSKRTIYKYIAGGDCPPYIRISAKNIKFDRADVDAWLESKKVFPRPGGKKMSDLTFVDRAKAALKNIVNDSKLRWTPRAQAVLERAQKQAHQDGCELLGTEHVLFGIISVEDCLGAVILRNLKVDKAKLREVYEQLNKDASVQAEGKTTNDWQNLTDSAQKAIRCASEEAARLGHEYVGAEHLLAAVLLVGEGWGHRILTELDVTLEKVRRETAKLIVSRHPVKE
ncbi:MAG TPA: helix-turn-helix domain-containing protein [Planctomycetes bacterium]|nr:helix-turn-helix domain-containing protein [Planctomycetota bacterium]